MITILRGIGIGTFLVRSLSNLHVERLRIPSVRLSIVAVCFSMLIGLVSAIMARRATRPLEQE